MEGRAEEFALIEDVRRRLKEPGVYHPVSICFMRNVGGRWIWYLQEFRRSYNLEVVDRF